MKIRRNIYIIIGVFFIVLDILSTLIRLNDLKAHFSSNAYDIGYVSGSQIFLLLGTVFLFGSYRVQKKIKNKQGQELENRINEIGNEHITAD